MLLEMNIDTYQKNGELIAMTTNNTQNTHLVPTYKKITIRYKHFMQEINTVWESFEVINFYSKVLHDAIKKETVPCPTILSLSKDIVTKGKIIHRERIFGTISHIKDKKNPRAALIESTLIFEKYISNIITMVYRDYPNKAISSDGNNENLKKMSEIILTSQDKEEIIERIIEEKVRGIFYGNIADIFRKDRAKLELKDVFITGDGNDLVDSMIEIFARRNAYIHNNGRVDRKYIRETGDSSVQLGNVLPLSSSYIKNTITVFSQIATVLTATVMRNIYNTDPKFSALLKTYWHK